MSLNKNMPGFIILGAAKSGTTSLYAYLQRHPDIFFPKLKEPEFFSREEVWNRGFSWYYELFRPAGPEDLCGEASTTYTRWPHTLDAARLINENTNVRRFIYIMRDPVERAFSHYQHHMRTGVTRTFEQALAEDDIYFDCGNYMMQIERYLRYFSKENFLFLFTDNLRNNPAAVLSKTQNFLEINPVDLVQEGIIVKNASNDDHYLRARTTQRLRKIPGLSSIINCFPAGWRGETFDFLKKSSFGKKIEEQHNIPQMLPNTRRKLIDLYAEPNKKLEQFLEMGLSHWSERSVHANVLP